MYIVDPRSIAKASKLSSRKGTDGLSVTPPIKTYVTPQGIERVITLHYTKGYRDQRA